MYHLRRICNMDGINIVKVWFHGGLFVFIISWLYFITIIGSLLFNTLLESIMFLALSMLLILPLLSGFINQIISKCIWNTQLRASFSRLWRNGILFTIIFLVSNYLLNTLGISDMMILMFNFIFASFIYGLIGKRLNLSRSSALQTGGKK